jgi:hypothetical protein
MVPLPSMFRHPEAKVVAFLLAVLACGEVGMRFIESRLSKDVGHLQQLDSIAGELDARYSEDIRGLTPPARQVTPPARRVVFLGNSLTRYGVVPDEFCTAVESRVGCPVHAVKLTPDNTALADWYYAYRNFLSGQGRAPDVLVLGFEGGHLRDAPSIHTDRLGRYYCDWDDLDDLFAWDLPTFEDRARYLLGSKSAIISNRDRIERRVLDLVIPGYRDGIQELNRRLKSNQENALPAATYKRLASLLDLARDDGVQVVVAAMPVPQPYDVDATLTATIDRAGAVLVDCRDVPGVTPAMFPDGVHMNPEAATRYSRFLAEQMQSRIAALAPLREEHRLTAAVE